MPDQMCRSDKTVPCVIVVMVRTS